MCPIKVNTLILALRDDKGLQLVLNFTDPEWNISVWIGAQKNKGKFHWLSGE